MRVDALGLSSLEVYLEHLERQVTQSGRHGLPIFNPFPRDRKVDMDRFRAARQTGWALPLHEPGWRRAWGVWDGARIVGGVELEGGRIAAEMHRASFTIGVEKSHHRRGLATNLSAAVIEWARADDTLEWLDLGVFSHNTAAIALYERLGFQRVGFVADRFRVDGEVIADIQMELCVEDGNRE